MSVPEDARLDYQDLRDNSSSALLATLSGEAAPEASYAPVVWLNDSCYLFLSELASHTRNLKLNPAIGLLLIEAESANPFARKRISLQGSAEPVARSVDLFADVMGEFRRRFGGVMDVIEPLPDFQLFRVSPTGGRFIRGFGQAYELSGAGLEELRPIDPRGPEKSAD